MILFLLRKVLRLFHWECDGGTEYDMSDGTAATPGTTITLYLNEDSYEFANEYKAREVVEKYCSFMPVPIFLTNEDAGEQTEEIPEEEVTDKDTVLDTFIKEAVTEEVEKEDGTKETVEKVPAKKMAKIVKRPVAINDIHPLWTKHPNECTEDEYKEFYRKVFNDYKEPLFWIHLNMDYPFNLKGILYFPKINTEYESIEGTIKLYNNQVFVADNIKEVIPEFLLLLKVLLIVQIFLLTYHVLHSRMMALLRRFLITLLKRLLTSFLVCARLTVRTMRNIGMTSTHSSNLAA